MKNIFLTLIAVTILITWVFASAIISPDSVQADIVKFLFPSMREQAINPSDSLQAPFADKEAQQENPVAEGQLPENAIAMDMPHRIDADIGEWLVTAVSESLSFTEADYNNDLARTRNYFTPDSRREYAEFLRSKGILKVITSGQYYIRNFVEDTPLLLNKGAVNGSYRWLFEVPIMLSYMDRSMVNYKQSEPVNQELLLTVQVGRDVNAKNEEGILIESWSGKVKNTNEK